MYLRTHVFLIRLDARTLDIIRITREPTRVEDTVFCEVDIIRFSFMI